MIVECHQSGAVSNDLPDQPFNEGATITDLDIRMRLAGLTQTTLDRGC
jgi:hypothetical protein